MRNILLVCITCCILTLSAYGQCPDNSVCVKQSVVDAAASVTLELLAARDTISKFAAERAATEAEREAATRLITRLNAVISVQDRLNLEYNAVILLYKSVVQMQSELIEKLSKEINAPKSAWNRFLGVLKAIATVATGILIGRAGI